MKEESSIMLKGNLSSIAIGWGLMTALIFASPARAISMGSASDLNWNESVDKPWYLYCQAYTVLCYITTVPLSLPTITGRTLSEFVQRMSVEERAALQTAQAEALAIRVDPDHKEGTASPNFNRAREVLRRYVVIENNRILSDVEDAWLIGIFSEAL
jgi:hypothetical protein